ncbi:MAG: TldD/PmbA family protein [Methanobacteriaceae archaeon]|nr:TldD/PmbA family protein [Methanobacteriaceae archaeon]
MIKKEEYSFDTDLIRKILTLLEEKADYLDLRISESLNNVIVMKDGKVQEITSGNNWGGCVRVLKNGAWGVSFTTNPGKMEDAGKSALKLANALDNDVKLADIEPTQDNVKSKAKLKLQDVSLDEKKESMSAAEKAANLETIVSTTVNYVDGEGTTIFVNSEGTELQIEESRVALFMNAVAASDGIIQFGHKSTGGAAGFEVIQKEDLEKFGRITAEKAVRLLKAELPPSGKFPVVMDPELTGVFIHEALGHASEADLILQNDSILKGKMGTQIGSSLVTIIDDATMDAFGYYPYDSEGVKTRKNILVKDGVLRSLLSSRETASQLDITPSGNARSVVGDQPIVRMSNTYLKPGELKFEELIEDMDSGIYLKGSRGGQVDTGKGVFQFNAAESFLIEDGEVTNPLRDVSLSGNILEMLLKVDGLGSDFKMGVGFCGKSGQTVPVGDGGPHVRVKEATVGGGS